MLGAESKFKSYKRETEPIYKIPKSVQQTIPVYAIQENGVFQIEVTKHKNANVTFDKCYRFSDVNYTDKDNREMESFFRAFCRILNSMNVSFKQIIANHNINPKEFEERVRLKNREGYEEVIAAYNDITDQRMAEARNIKQEKYLVITCQKQDFESANAYFNSLEANLRNSYFYLGSRLTPLNALERLEVLYRFYNLGKEREFSLTRDIFKSKRNWKDDICNVFIKETKSHIEFENRYVTVLFAKQYPSGLSDAFLSNLTSLSLNTITCVDCNPIPNEVVMNALNDSLQRVEVEINRQQDYRNRHMAFSTDISYDLRRKKEELEASLDQMRSNDARMFYTGFLVLLTASTLKELQANVQTLKALGQSSGVTLEVFMGRQIRAMNTALPVGYRGVSIMRSMFTQCVAALMPFHVQELDEESGIVYGINQVSKNLLIGNRKLLPNGNGFVFGTSGFGKSVNAKYEMGQVIASSNDDVIIIDPLNEYFEICRNWGGQVVNLSTKSTDYMNPFDMPQRSQIANVQNFLADKAEFVLAICAKAILPDQLNARHRSVIVRCVTNIYQSAIKGDTESPTFITFREELLKQDEAEAKELALSLEAFAEGALSLFSHQSNVNINNRFICYGIAELGRDMMALGLLVMIENVRNRIISNAKIGRATWVYVDECHVVLDDDYGQSAFEKLWKEVRKQGGLMTGITQNIGDCLINKKTKAMLANSEFIVFLNQSGIDKTMLDDVLEISNAQMQYITNAKKGTGIMRYGEKLIPFDNTIPKDNRLYEYFNTNLHEQVLEGKFQDTCALARDIVQVEGEVDGN